MVVSRLSIKFRLRGLSGYVTFLGVGNLGCYPARWIEGTIMISKLLAVGVFVFTFSLFSTAHAAVIAFDDSGDFTAALPAGVVTTVDTFDNDIAQDLSITLDSGVVSTASSLFNFPVNSVFGGVFEVGVDGDGNAAPETITLLFPTPIIGFGFDVEVANNIFFQLLEITIDGGAGPETFLFSDFITTSGTESFAGFVADTAFTTAVFSNPVIVFNTIEIDNLIFAAAPAPIPLPAVIWLFLSGLAGIGIARWAR